MEVYPFFQNHQFSNWWMNPFVVEGIQYNCGEQWMMAQKALLFGDKDVCQKIMTTNIPSRMKALGKKVRSFNEQMWAEKRCELVKIGLRAKFSQDEDCRRMLLSTADKIICEASPYDRIWGIGIRANHPNINNPEKWQGLNLLGKVLMEIRTELRD